ncbi:SDR family oxidoreductase [Rahnella sp. PCH160]|uniref:SDR family oxidoreductase n=1 Tax=Rahnella sp. PCH160 TaxID=3447928 RepID=UPI0039FDA404
MAEKAGAISASSAIPASVGETVRVVVWLCSDEARFVTGQNLLVDGGFTIAGLR